MWKSLRPVHAGICYSGNNLHDTGCETASPYCGPNIGDIDEACRPAL